MRIVACVAVATLGMLQLTRAAVPQPSLCRRLASKVQRAPFHVAPGRNPLKPWLFSAKAEWPLTVGSAQSAANSLLRHTLEAKGFMAHRQPAELEHLPGTDVYMLGTMGGSAECQTAAFAKAARGTKALLLPNPKGYTAPCWNVHGQLATVLGEPAYVELGTVSMTDPDTLVRVTPWVKNMGWGRPCQLAFRMQREFRLTKRFCGNHAVCRAAGSVAVNIARAYFAYRHLPKQPKISFGPYNRVPNFSYPPQNGAGVPLSAAVSRAWHLLMKSEQTRSPGASRLYSLLTAKFPVFGHRQADDGWSDTFSYVDFALFSVTLNRRHYLGAVGLNGIGWKEGSNTLFAVYELPTPVARKLTPLAGFVITRSAIAVKDLIVTEGNAAMPARHGM
jgi:hypothetical protein